MQLGIIGTAGRKEDAEKLSWKAWIKMLSAALHVIDKEGVTSFVSGGAAWAAWADAVAVHLYINAICPDLTLHLPAKWDKDRFVEDNAGKTANYYHQKFQEKTGVQSLVEIGRCVDFSNAKITYSKGFFERNSLVAKDAEIMLAMTFGNGKELKDGGTKDTWDKFIAKKNKKGAYHFDLNTFVLHKVL